MTTFLANTFTVGIASLAVAWAGLSFMPTAHAEPEVRTFKVAIKYSADATATLTYDSIKRQARAACQRQAATVKLTHPMAPPQWMQRCNRDLVGKAVAAIGRPELTALHDGKSDTGSQIAAR